MNSQMTIGKKLMLSFAVLMVLMVALSLTFLSVVDTLKGSFDTAVDKTTRKMILAADMDDATSDMLVAQRGMMLWAFVKDDAKTDENRRKFSPLTYSGTSF